jgi:hypothetical protein
MLLRKPLKEGFYVLEAIVANRAQFANRLLTNPISLDGKAAGGVEVHEQRIAAVINKISGGNRFTTRARPTVSMASAILRRISSRRTRRLRPNQ